MPAKKTAKSTKVTKPATVRPKATKILRAKKTQPAAPQRVPEPSKKAPETAPVETKPAELVQHVPGQVEEQPPQPQVPQSADEIPAEGNNIASVHDRAHADMPPANFQPPVEKTFVSPKDLTP